MACIKQLYIPIWLCSNTLPIPCNIALATFTFQSGYVQIEPCSGYSFRPYNFTFQSGYVQISFALQIWPSRIVFTFQSGYVQIYRKRYGGKAFRLYIPIWLCSNYGKHVRGREDACFTFQSGYVQILSCFVLSFPLSSFTFQSGYVQIHSFDNNKTMKYTFTFQSGYIQII